jgi:hypothetical protein
MLQDFCKKMDGISYKLYDECNERISTLATDKNMCKNCFNKSNRPKKFSAENNMDLDDIPEELKGLSEIKEMLISQVFTVITVYQLHEDQNGYRGNIINFP